MVRATDLNSLRLQIDTYLIQLGDKIDNKLDLPYPAHAYINPQQIHARLCRLLEIHIEALNLLQDVFSTRQNFQVQIPGGSAASQSLSRKVAGMKEAEFVLKDRLRVLELQIETMRSFFSALSKADTFITQLVNVRENQESALHIPE